MVELWMSEVADNMKDSLIDALSSALDEWTWQADFNYFEKYPGQCIYCAFVISWTRAVEQHIKSTKKWSVRCLTIILIAVLAHRSVHFNWSNQFSSLGNSKTSFFCNLLLIRN